MDPTIEAAFDAWLASMGMNRSSPIPYGQEAALTAQWESFLLNYGRNQGRATQGPTTAWGTPAPYGAAPQYQSPQPGGGAAPFRTAPTYGGGGGGPAPGGGVIRYAPPVATNRR